jgi:cephalosporin hydroxylase
MPFMEESLDWPLSKVLPILQKRIMEQTTYHGIQTLKNPLDLWIYQEIIWETRPDIIVEIGNLYGGSTLALAHICDALGGGKIIAVDSNHAPIVPQVRSHPRITLVTGEASTVFPVVQRMISTGQEVMIIEDSLHTYHNTLTVLETYAGLVGLGKYFIVEDGICHHGLEVGPNPGPYEAVENFTGMNKNFTIDRNRETFGITWNPKGFLKRIHSS